MFLRLTQRSPARNSAHVEQSKPKHTVGPFLSGKFLFPWDNAQTGSVLWDESGSTWRREPSLVHGDEGLQGQEMWERQRELVVMVTWYLMILLQWPHCHFYFKFCLNSYHLYTVRSRQLLHITTYSSFICKWETGAHPRIYNPDLMCYETLEKGFCLSQLSEFS